MQLAGMVWSATVWRMTSSERAAVAVRSPWRHAGLLAGVLLMTATLLVPAQTAAVADDVADREERTRVRQFEPWNATSAPESPWSWWYTVGEDPDDCQPRSHPDPAVRVTQGETRTTSDGSAYPAGEAAGDSHDGTTLQPSGSGGTLNAGEQEFNCRRQVDDRSSGFQPWEAWGTFYDQDGCEEWINYNEDGRQEGQCRWVEASSTRDRELSDWSAGPASGWSISSNCAGADVTNTSDEEGTQCRKRERTRDYTAWSNDTGWYSVNSCNSNETGTSGRDCQTRTRSGSTYSYYTNWSQWSTGGTNFVSCSGASTPTFQRQCRSFSGSPAGFSGWGNSCTAREGEPDQVLCQSRTRSRSLVTGTDWNSWSTWGATNSCSQSSSNTFQRQCQARDKSRGYTNWSQWSAGNFVWANCTTVDAPLRQEQCSERTMTRHWLPWSAWTEWESPTNIPPDGCDAGVVTTGPSQTETRCRDQQQERNRQSGYQPLPPIDWQTVATCTPSATYDETGRTIVNCRTQEQDRTRDYEPWRDWSRWGDPDPPGDTCDQAVNTWSASHGFDGQLHTQCRDAVNISLDVPQGSGFGEDLRPT